MNWLAYLADSKSTKPRPAAAREAADVLILNGRLYPLAWGEPGLDGTPAPDADMDDKTL